MKLVSDRCSLVLVGAWNRSIFSPEWVGKRVFPEASKVQVDLQFGASVLRRFTIEKVQLLVSSGQVQFKPMTSNMDGFKAAESAARSLLRFLPETPVRAMGLNVGFTIARSEQLARVLSLGDSALIKASGAAIASTTLTRQLLYGTNVINLSVVDDEDGLFLDFNHELRGDAAHISNYLHGSRYVEALEKSRQLAATFYSEETT